MTADRANRIASPRGPRPRRLDRAAAAVALAVGLLVGAGGAWAEPFFSIDRPDVVVDSTVEIEQEDRVTRGTKTSEDTRTLTEEVEIDTRGWVYHPALAIFSLELRPEFRLQDTQASNDFEHEDQTVFFGYTFDSTVLQHKPYSLKLYSNRGRSEFDSTLSPDSITEFSLDRAEVLLKYQPLPTTFTVERRETDFQGFNEYTDTSLTGRIESRHETDDSKSRFKTEYVQQERNQLASKFTTDRVSASATNAYRITDDLRLFSGILGTHTDTTSNQSSDLDVIENVYWRITPDLRDETQLRYRKRTEDAFDSQTIVGSNTFTHQLYENLTTTFLTEGSDDTFTNGAIREYRSRLDFRYVRKIPWGSIGVTNGYGIRYQDNEFDARFTDIRDESLGLSGTSLTFLENEDVDLTSVVVTDATGLTVFTENIDYIVTQFGRSIAIQRVGVGSSIPDGATVLVDYRFQAQGPFELYNTSWNAGTSLRLFDGLRLYYNYSTAKDHLLSGTPSGTLTDDEIHRMGAELQWRWSTTNLDYEIHDTARTPFNRLQLREAVSFQPMRRLSLGLGTGYTESEFTDTGEETTQVDATATARWQPFRWGQFDANAFARLTRGDVQETDDIGLLSSFRWRYGAWSGRLSYEFLRQEDLRSDQTRDRQAFLVSVSRRF